MSGEADSEEIMGTGRRRRRQRRGRGKVGDALKKGWQKVKQFAHDNKLGSKLVDAAGSALKAANPEWAPAIGAVQDKVGKYVAKKGYGYKLAGERAGMGSRKSVGSKREVFNGTADRTSGGLTRAGLMKNKRGKIVSKAKHSVGLRAMKYLKPFTKRD